LYDPSQFAAPFPSWSFLLPMSTRRRTRSPRSKSLGLTFLLYRVVVACLMETSIMEAKFLYSSMKSSSSRVASALAVWSSGCAVLQLSSFTSTGITTSVLKVRRKGVSPMVECGVVRYAHKKCEGFLFPSFQPHQYDPVGGF